MRDIWKYWDESYFIVIPTNLQVKGNGEAVMGAGLAKQAADRCPGLAKDYGFALQQGCGRYVSFGHRILCLPTKRDWRDKVAHLSMIVEGVVWLLDVAKQYPDHKIAVPKLGCGLGRLDWGAVKEVLAPLYNNDQFVIVE